MAPLRRLRAGDAAVAPATAPDLRQKLSFKWGASVELDPATGRPRHSSRILSPTDGYFLAREAVGGGGTLTVNTDSLPYNQRPPSYMRGRRMLVEDLELTQREMLLRRLVCDPLWREREQMRMRRELWHHK